MTILEFFAVVVGILVWPVTVFAVLLILKGILRDAGLIDKD